jgi:two-component sensor histidine kinase
VPPNLYLAAERDHRVSNSLSMIASLVQLKARHARAEEARLILLDAAGRINAVGRLHRLLAACDTADVPLGRFLEEVCGALASFAADAGATSVAVDCPPALTLPPMPALRLGLLTAELFSNAVKYAHPTGIPTVIRVACAEEPGGSFRFVFEDDGIGFPEDFRPEASDGLGMRILRSLVAEMRGRCEWKDRGIGLRFVCRFPAPAPAPAAADDEDTAAGRDRLTAPG